MLHIYVTTPALLPPEHKQKIEKKLEAQLKNEKLTFHYQVDESLLGGLQVSIGSTLYDGSLKAKLAKLAAQLK